MTYCVTLFTEHDYESIAVLPRWWHNFLDAKTDLLDEVDDINTVLLEFSAHFSCSTDNSRNYGTRYLDFYDESAFFWFILKWS